MPLTSIVGLLACSLVAVSFAMMVLNIWRLPVAARWLAFAALAASMAFPIDGMMIAGHVRGLIGDPSIATIALMMLVCIKQLIRRDVCDTREVAALLHVVLIGGIILYPLALGYSPIDPYALGFGSWPMYAVLLAIALAAWRLRFNLVMWWIVASVIAFALGVFESTNLWNYLLDPIAVIIAVAWTAAEWLKWLWRSIFARKEVIA